MHKKILIVDDEENIVKALKRELLLWAKENSFEILTSNNPVEALEITEKNSKDLVLIISDLRMPNMTGSDMLLKIKEKYPEIMSILLSGFSEVKEIMKAVKAGIFSYLLKPWDEEYLIAEINKAVDVYNLNQERKEYYKKINEELFWGGEIQKRILNIKLPENIKIDFDVSYMPLEGLYCGGDYYDLFMLTKDRYIALLGDVSGHGIKAAFITAILKSVIYSEYIKYHQEDFSADEFLCWLNKKICKELKKFPEIVITFLCVLIDLENYTLEYSNAGHLPFYIIRNKAIKKIHADGAGLGFSEDCKFKLVKYKIEKDDRLVMFTDGLVEIGESRVIFNENKFAKYLVKSNENDFNKSLIKTMKEHNNNKDFLDDMTLLNIKVN